MALKAGLYDAGHYYDTNYGILKGSPLSHVLGGFYLIQVDQAFSKKPLLRYLRYMDDILILAKTRSALKKAIVTCRKNVEQLKLKLSFEKTYVGRSNKKFSFLGYYLQSSSQLEVPSQTITKSLARVTSLLEQQVLTKERLEKHVRGFVNWAKGGLAKQVNVILAQRTLVDALERAGIYQRPNWEDRHKNYKSREKLWLQEYWHCPC